MNDTHEARSDVIVIEGLVKRFGSTRALDGLDLRVRAGEIHGFLGPNGSGKSTTIRVLLGLLRRDAGTVRMLGGDPWRDAVELHRRIAYVPGEVNLWPNLSGGEVIDLLCRLRGNVNVTRRDALVEQFELDPSKRFDSYSKGNRQKVALVSALAADAELYLFDEPTVGLDPIMEERFREHARGLHERGATILLSSHILAEVEALCDRVTIIREGRTVESGVLDEMRHLTRATVHVHLEQSPALLEQVPGVHELVHNGNEASFEVDPDQMSEVVRRLAPLGVRLLESSPTTLEQLFLRHYRGEPAGRP